MNHLLWTGNTWMGQSSDAAIFDDDLNFNDISPNINVDFNFFS